MASDGWDLRSNIKAKPGSQGTLFQHDKSVLNPAQRWPRGYEPERQAAVNETLSHGTVFKGTDFVHDRALRARVVDTVSRSTIPTSHLEGLRKVEHTTSPGTAGVYYPRDRRVGAPMFNPRRQRGDEMGQVLIHELGHHHDEMVTPHPSRVGITEESVQAEAVKHLDARREDSKFPLPSEPNTTMKAQAAERVYAGRAEGYADNYLQEHYRTRGRNPQSVSTGAYEHNFTETKIQNQYPGYRDIRPAPHMGPQFQDVEIPELKTFRQEQRAKRREELGQE